MILLFYEKMINTLKEEFLRLLFNCFLLWTLIRAIKCIYKFIVRMWNTIVNDNLDTSSDTEFLVKND